MRTCLLVVDLQRGFIGEHTRHIVSRIRELLELNLFSATVFTQFINDFESPYRRYLNWHSLSNQAEQEIIPEVRQFASTHFTKTTYGINNNQTLEYIKSEKFAAVFIIGIDTDGCVLKTSVDLFENNIRTFILQDYCASTGGPDFHQAAIKILSRLIGPQHLIAGPLAQQQVRAAMSAIKTDEHGPSDHF